MQTTTFLISLLVTLILLTVVFGWTAVAGEEGPYTAGGNKYSWKISGYSLWQSVLKVKEDKILKGVEQYMDSITTGKTYWAVVIDAGTSKPTSTKVGTVMVAKELGTTSTSTTGWVGATSGLDVQLQKDHWYIIGVAVHSSATRKWYYTTTPTATDFGWAEFHPGSYYENSNPPDSTFLGACSTCTSMLYTRFYLQSPLTCSISSITESSIYAHVSGIIVYYSTTSSGSFTVEVSTNPEGVQKVNFPNTVSNGGDDTSSPYSWVYDWDTADWFDSLATATCYGNVGNTNITTFRVDRDSSSPAGGYINYPNGYITTASVSTYPSAGYDTESGVNQSSDYIERQEATLSAGTCGVFGSWSTVNTDPGSFWADTGVSNGNCYKYRYSVRDNVYNLKTYTPASIAKIDTTPPSVGQAEIHPGSTYTDGTNYWYRGNIGVRATASDGESGISSCLYSIDNGNTWSFAAHDGTYCKKENLSPGANITINLRATNGADVGIVGTSRSYIYDSSVQTPTIESHANMMIYNAATIPATFSGKSKDSITGAGLNADSVTFYIKKGDKYWDGDSWETIIAWLSTTHSATAGNTEITWTDNVNLPSWTDGTYSTTVRATDKLGNIAGADILFVYDTTPPSTSISSVAGDTLSPYWDASNDLRTDIKITSPEQGIKCRWGTTDAVYSSMDATNECSISYAAPSSTATCPVGSLSEGSYTRHVSCKDAVGNEQITDSAQATGNEDVGFGVDWTRPAVNIDSPVASTWFGTDFTLQYDATDANLDACTVSTKDGDGSWTERSTCTNNNDQTLRITVGNGKYCTIEGADKCSVKVYARDKSVLDNFVTRDFSIDRTPPRIDSLSHSPQAGVTEEVDVTIRAEVSDPQPGSGLTKINIYVDNQLKCASPPCSYTCTSSPCEYKSKYREGVHNYYAEAFDKVDKATSQPQSFRVFAPEILYVKKGWNLISIPYSTFNFVSSTCDPGRSLYNYNTGAKTWDVVKHVKDTSGGKGYWLYSDGPCEIKIIGIDEFPHNQIQLINGWNHIGSPVNEPNFNAIKGGCTIQTILYYDTSIENWKTLDATSNLEPYKAYFIKAAAC